MVIETIQKTITVDPFFEDAINQVFLYPNKTGFVMDGPIGGGKSSRFVAQGAYSIAQLVEPIKKGNNLVRESRWACVRESENSSKATILQIFRESIFTPEITALKNSPVKVYGEHPAIILVTHDLPDGTVLEMKIECHGFNNQAADNRLRTHEYMGAMVFEMQGIPFNIFEVVQERCGRFRTNTLKISKVINGKKYTLSGIIPTAITLADINIPERPHLLYDNYYDVADKNRLPYKFITPPKPLNYKPVDQIDKKTIEQVKKLIKLEQDPVTMFEGERVIWLPNPKFYFMTRHYEENDEDGNKIPWSGYKYWYNRLHRTDSAVRRYVLGEPDTVGGESSIYKKFKRDDQTIIRKNLDLTKEVYIGYDPGGYAAIVLCQLLSGNVLHFFNEFIFEPSDRTDVREQFSEYLFPYCRKKLQRHKIFIIPDPASTFLGKNIMTGQEETVINMIRDELRIESIKHPESLISYKLLPCLVSNQNTSARINSLRYFIDKKLITVDPDCQGLIASLSGGYQRKKLKSGIISDNIDKDNPHSHPAEAAQYLAVNILTGIKKKQNVNRNKSKRKVYRIAS